MPAQRHNIPFADKKIANRFKVIRNFHGLSQEQVADMLGVARLRISQYETAKRPIPAEVLTRIRTSFHVDLETLSIDPPHTQRRGQGGCHNMQAAQEILHLLRSVEAIGDDDLSHFYNAVIKRFGNLKAKEP